MPWNPVPLPKRQKRMFVVASISLLFSGTVFLIIGITKPFVAADVVGGAALLASALVAVLNHFTPVRS